MPVIKVLQAQNAQYYWVLYATNWEAICWSEQYTTKYSAIQSAERAKQLMAQAYIQQ